MTMMIGVVHATPLSLAALTGPLATHLPHARVRNVLDDSLLADLQERGRLTPQLEVRMERLVAYLLSEPVDALQFACSGFAPVVERVAAGLSIPVRTPDAAMYHDLAASPRGHVGIVATVPAALRSAEERLNALLASRGRSTVVSTAAVPEALPMAQAGDHTALAAALEAVVPRLRREGAEVIAFAQYSLAPVASIVAQRTGVAIVTGPDAAARDLAAALTADHAT